MWLPFIVQRGTQTQHSFSLVTPRDAGGVAEGHSVCWDSERTRNLCDSVKPTTFRLQCSGKAPGRSFQTLQNLIPDRGKGTLGEVKCTDLFPK